MHEKDTITLATLYSGSVVEVVDQTNGAHVAPEQ